MDDIKHLVIDMDGVLWQGEQAMPGLVSFFETLKRRGLPYVLATNNAMKLSDDYVLKLRGMNVEMPPERILTSAEAAAQYIRRHYPELSEVYVVGEGGLRRAVERQGLTIISPQAVREGRFVPLVVGGLVRESLSYELLAMATLLVRQGAHFIATNYDPSYPTELGQLPGAGAVLSVIERATGVTPTIIGKPEPHLFDEALYRLGAPAQDTAMIGDRLSTDIAGAKAAGMRTILLLSGVTDQAELDASDIRPDYIFKDIAALQEVWI
jgi:4-nitrophenyl phosphatase